MGFSEVARATQTPDLSTQHHTPHHGVTEPATGPSAAEAGQAVLPGFGQDSSRTSSLCPGTLHRPALCPPLRGCPSSLGSAWDFGAQSHIPRPVAALLGPLPSHFRKSRTLYPNCLLPALPTLCRGGASAAQASEEQIICSLPAPLLGRSGHRSGSTTLPPTCPAGLVSLEAPGRWLGPSCPRPPSFYLCWCLQFGVGSLGRQLRPVLAERCCLSLCGWTRLSLAPPRTL